MHCAGRVGWNRRALSTNHPFLSFDRLLSQREVDHVTPSKTVTKIPMADFFCVFEILSLGGLIYLSIYPSVLKLEGYWANKGIKSWVPIAGRRHPFRIQTIRSHPSASMLPKKNYASFEIRRWEGYSQKGHITVI